MRVGGQLAKLLSPPAILLLEGTLGAGKTSFVRGFVRALAPDANIRVQSPTFSLAHAYPTVPIVHHLDLYRLGSAAEAQDLGIDECFHEQASFVCVEWPENGPELFTGLETISLQFSPNPSRSRRITVTFPSSLEAQIPRWQEALATAAQGKSTKPR